MTRLFTSGLHLGHSNTIALAGSEGPGHVMGTLLPVPGLTASGECVENEVEPELELVPKVAAVNNGAPCTAKICSPAGRWRKNQPP